MAGLSHSFDMYFMHCFIWRPSDSNVSEDAGINFAALALTFRRYNHLTRSHPHRLDLIQTRLDLIKIGNDQGLYISTHKV